MAVIPQQGGGTHHSGKARLGLAVIQHHRAGISRGSGITRQHPTQVQLRRGQPRHPQNPLNHQAITGAAVIEDVHQGHLGRFRGLTVIHHHLNPQGPQSH